jgi:hypothetical protein
MSTPAWSRVVLADPGDINPVVLTVADLAYSWEVANAGQLSCRIPARDLFAAGITNRIGKWISAEHSTAGAWPASSPMRISTSRAGRVESRRRAHHACAARRPHDTPRLHTDQPRRADSSDAR